MKIFANRVGLRKGLKVLDNMFESDEEIERSSDIFDILVTNIESTSIPIYIKDCFELFKINKSRMDISLSFMTNYPKYIKDFLCCFKGGIQFGDITESNIP